MQNMPVVGDYFAEQASVGLSQQVVERRHVCMSGRSSIVCFGAGTRPHAYGRRRRQSRSRRRTRRVACRRSLNDRPHRPACCALEAPAALTASDVTHVIRRRQSGRQRNRTMILGPVHTSNNVEATFDFVATNGNNVERFYCKISSFRQSRMLLRHCCWY